MHWFQRSRVKWLQDGDRNTKYFHAIAIQRNNRNRILRIKDKNGRWVDADREIKSVIRDFFVDLFQAPPDSNMELVLSKIQYSVSGEMNEALIAPVSNDEIKTATFSLGAFKAPGPDGYPGLFFHKAWSEVGEDVCSTVKNFFASGVMPQGLNYTNIVLIPKVTIPSQVNQFRPISLCNFVYKIISKILVLRLKPWLNTLVHPCQAAFLPNRNIQDNILIAHEITNAFKKSTSKRNGNCAIKLDVYKAYDSVSWRFLVETLSRMGFADCFVNWIRQCISTVKYSVLVNGEATEDFIPSRGLRQGDPLSPYLFLLVSNSLSLLLDEAIRNGSLHGIKLNPRSPLISHMLFADDTILFGLATATEAQQFKMILNQYESASGQQINVSKSSLLFSKNTSEESKQQIKEILGMQEMEASDRYLGVPSQWGRSKAQTLSFLVDRVAHKAQTWKHKLLSNGGREVMAKAVLTAIPTYIFSCFRAPKSVCRKLDSVVSKFWWGVDQSKRGLILEKWSNVAKSKFAGGLGFKSFGSFNLALIAKQAWRLVTDPHCLWARLMKGLYYPHTDFWNAKKGSKPSWSWASILEVRDYLHKGARILIGNGHNTSFWSDPWIPDLQNFKLSSSQPRDNTIFKVADVITDTREWNLTKLTSMLSPQEVIAIQKIPVGASSDCDTWVWNHDKKGSFSVKKAYQLIFQEEEIRSSRNHPSTSTLVPTSRWKNFWDLKLPTKIGIFMWKACKDRLPSKEQLFKRKIVDSPLCEICKKEVESVEHILLLCDHARAAWLESNIGIIPSISLVTSFADWWDSLTKRMKTSNAMDIMVKAAFLCWQLWKQRNNFIFKGSKLDPKKSFEDAHFQFSEFLPF